MHMNQKTRLVLAMAFSVASSAALAQDAVFSDLVTCTKGKCASGYSVTARTSSDSEGECHAYGLHKVTISYNGETQTITATCSGSSSCFASVEAAVGGQQFYVDVDAQSDPIVFGGFGCRSDATGGH